MKHFKVIFLIIGLIISLWSCNDESSKEKKYEVSKCFVQKGPFVQGSDISIIELTDNFEPSGKVFNTETKDDLGSFSISAMLNSKFVDINANGYYFNEVSGRIDGPISLKVFTDLSSVKGLNINILTLLAKDRIKQLMLKDKKVFEEAKKQAEGEILRIFNIPTEISANLLSFDKMDISANNESAAVLLAISITIQGNLSAGELSELLAKISNDIADNGAIDNNDLKTKLNNNSHFLDSNNIRFNVFRRYSDLNLNINVAPFEKYIDINNNGVIDSYDIKLNTPNGNVFNLKPEFSWVPSEDPTVEYQFQISSDGTFDSIIEEAKLQDASSYQLKDSLEYDKNYYWRVAIIDVKTGNKSWTSALQITPKSGIVNLITFPNISIGATSAVCSGTIINDGGAFITEKGIVYSTSANPTTINNKIVGEFGIDNFTCQLAGLMPNTTYYVKAYAINNVGIFYGEEVVFTTQSGIVNLTTSPITRIGPNSAFCGGTIINDGGELIIESGVVFSKDANPTTNNNKINIGSGVGNFTHELSGLTTNTIYHLRAYVINNVGTFYGEEVVFTTQSGIVDLVTSPAIGIGANSSVCVGIVKSNGGYKVTERGFEFSYTSNPNINTTKIISTKKDSFSIYPNEYRFKNIIMGLKANTTYYVRAYAVNQQGTSYGDEVSFTTLSGGLTGTVTDIDGNIYTTVTIGTQVWMGENLKTTKYRNGDPIPNITENNSWGNLTTGAYCNYNNDVNIGNTYGRLYNGYAVTDSRNIAPAGWHVATMAECMTLINYLGGIKSDNTVVGGKLREFGTTHWIGNYPTVTNETGFTAIGGGTRMENEFNSIGVIAQWWNSISETSDLSVWQVFYDGHLSAGSNPIPKVNGFSVRCIKD